MKLFTWSVLSLTFCAVACRGQSLVDAPLPAEPDNAAAPVSTANPDTANKIDIFEEQRRVQEEVMGAFNAERFGDLEAIADRFRRGKERLSNADWKLEEFYEALTSEARNHTQTQEQAFVTRLGRWSQAQPSPGTWRVVQAAADTHYAFRERSTALAAKVTRRQWAGFEKYLNEALELLTEGEGLPIASQDPHFYAVLAEVHLYRKVDKARAIEAFRKGAAIQQNYYPLYDVMALHLYRRWGGWPGELVEFAENAVKSTQATDGETLYARIAIRTYRYEGTRNFFELYRFDWDRIKRGLSDRKARFPHDNVVPESYGHLACLYGDRAEAARLFRSYGNRFNASNWDSPQILEGWRRWALENGPAPEQP